MIAEMETNTWRRPLTPGRVQKPVCPSTHIFITLQRGKKNQQPPSTKCSWYGLGEQGLVKLRIRVRRGTFLCSLRFASWPRTTRSTHAVVIRNKYVLSSFRKRNTIPCSQYINQTIFRVCFVVSSVFVAVFPFVLQSIIEEDMSCESQRKIK